MVWTVYILTNKNNGTLYVGVTRDLRDRLERHRAAKTGFVQRYSLNRLVFYEDYGVPGEAIIREKQLKKWRRKWKIELIEGANPEWEDLNRYIPGSPLTRG